MSRKVFEALSIFDWVTPLIGFAQDIINDPTPLQTNSWTFFIPYDAALAAGWNAIQIEDFLNQYGVKNWGSQITGGELFFSVQLEKAQWAEYLLLRQGIPINPKYLGAPRPKAGALATTTTPAGRQHKPGLLGWLDRVIPGGER